jgi:hypothetical protein
MVKKIFDILPPKKEELKREERVIIVEKRRTKFHFPRIPLGTFLILLFIFLLIFSFFFSFELSKAEVKIWPKTEEISFVEGIVVDSNATAMDFEQKIIPGKIFETEEVFSKSFNSTGKVLKKAEGTIRLFNEYSTQDEVWREGTRFISSDGKLFKSKDKIHVPGAKIENGKIVASFVDVPVIAAEGGVDYNIPPSDFSVVAFKGSPRYFKYYGKSFEPMKGGGEAPQVLKEDLERAEKEIVDLINQKAKEILEKKVEKKFSFSDDAIEVSILDKSFSAKEGEEKEKFDGQFRAKIKTIVFSNDDLLNFAKEYLSLKVPKGKEIHLPSLKTELKAETKNFELGKANFQLKISAKVYSKIDPLTMKKSLAGKSIEEAKIFLPTLDEISKVKIEVFPFWTKKLPADIKRIEIVYPQLD